MKKFIMLGVLGVTIIMLASAFAVQIQKATHTVELEDAAGDVNDSGDSPGKDVIKVILDTDGENVNIAVVLAKEAKFYLDGHMAGDVIDVILDTDNDQATGGKPFFYEKSGFEYKIQVGACIEYEGGGVACSGALRDTKALNFFSTYALHKFTEGSDTEQVSESFNWKSRGRDIQGNRVEVSVPYAQMELQSGQSIRLAVKERADSTFKKEYLPEVLLTIK
jgi:hypothetical protein